MSETSGTVSRPPRPTTSTGTSRASSAARSAANWARFRHSTAMSLGLTFAVLPSGHGLRVGSQSGGEIKQSDHLVGYPGGFVLHGLKQRASH